MKRTAVIISIVVVLAVAGYFGFQRYQQARAQAASNFQTVTVSRGDLTASVGATGTVNSNQSAVVSWQLSGQVGEVLVQPGDMVEAGQRIASLDERSLPQSVILARADLIAAQRNLDALLNSGVARAQANQTLILAQKELEDALKRRESKDYARALPATVDEARANLVIAEDAVKRANQLYDTVDDRDQDDPVRAEAFAQLSRARKNYDTQLANLNYLLGRPNEQEVSEADARVALAQASLEDAQREWDRLKDGPDPQDIAAAEARIAAIESALEQDALEAPFRGTITQVNVKPGDQVAPGTPAFRVDDLSQLLVEVQVTEVDINRIRPGQPVMMTFDAIPDREYTGKVADVARVGIALQGVVNFTVTVALEDPQGEVRSGMTAAVNIITDLVEDVLVVPNRAVRLREGRRVVYVLRDGAPVMTEITLGVSSDTISQVEAGVSAGDVLVLNPPVTFSPMGGGPSGGMGR